MKRVLSYLSAAVALFALAVSVTPASALGSSSLSIQPKKNYIIKPGQTVTDKLTIGNLDKDNDLYITLKPIDFTYTDQSGTPKLAIADGAPQTPWSLKPFMKLPKEAITIPKGGSKTVNYTISIPKEQGAGSYYSAIMYQAGGASGGNVALNASGVTLAFVSVPGQVKEKMTLEKLGAYTSKDNGSTGSYVFIATNDQPKMVAFTVKNEGNVFEAPAGNLVVKSMFGKEVANVTTNPNQSLALLGQTRIYTSCLKTVEEQVKAMGGTAKNKTCASAGLWPGRYTVSLDVFYGQNGNQTHEITGVASFWYLPWWFLAIVAVVIALLVWFFFFAKKKIQRTVKGSSYKAGKGITRKKR